MLDNKIYVVGMHVFYVFNHLVPQYSCVVKSLYLLLLVLAND